MKKWYFWVKTSGVLITDNVVICSLKHSVQVTHNPLQNYRTSIIVITSFSSQLKYSHSATASRIWGENKMRMLVNSDKWPVQYILGGLAGCRVTNLYSGWELWGGGWSLWREGWIKFAGFKVSQAHSEMRRGPERKQNEEGPQSPKPFTVWVNRGKCYKE